MRNIDSVKGSGIATFVAQAGEVATPAKYAEIPVDIQSNLLRTVANSRPVPSGLTALGVGRVRQMITTGPRAYAFIRELDYTAGEQTIYRVFLDCDYLSADTPVTDKHYVGSFAFFGSHGSHGGEPAAKPSLGIDLTSAIQRVYGSQPDQKNRIRLQIQPVPNKASAAGKAGTCKPSRVEVAIISA